MASVTVKPPLWVPGQNPDAAELWRGCICYLAHWEGVGDRVFDISGHGNHGVMTGTPDWGLGAFGPEHAYKTNGPYLDCGNIGDQMSDTELSAFVLWEQPTYYTQGFTLFAKGSYYNADSAFAIVYGESNYRISCSVKQESRWFELPGASGGYYTVGISYKKNAWGDVYLNGVDMGDLDNFDQTIPLASNNVQIGATGTGGRTYPIPVAILWRRALRPEERRILAADPFYMIRPPSPLPIYASAFSAAGAPPGQPTVKRFANVPFCYGYQGRAA